MDKYTKVKKIGEGSFGTAILVKHNESGEHFVVKEIGISKMKTKERNEARKEVLVLSKMRHPNIVQYTESFEENGHLYIIMEYCEGGDLYALINKQRGVAFPERQVLSWFVQICLALKHVHDRKILHRDIKTSNIFLTKSGTIKLGDFGIARVLNNTMELARTCIGTPYYLSPEICENKPYNNKSDVWALGCVVYETLTLKHAFEAGNMKNLVLKIIRGSYPPVPSRYSYELRSLISQLFRRNPRERPSINSILRKPFISPLTAEHLSQEQHEAEFSHTVLHKGRKPAPRPSPANPSRYQPQPAAKRARNLEIYGAQVGVRNRRDQQIAAAYGPSVAAKPKPKPSRLANAHNAVDNILEKKRQQLLEQERIRKENLIGEKKRRLEEMQKRQRDRAIKMKEDQLRRARDEARILNLKRSADMLNDEEEKVTKPPRPSGRDRPVSAPRERGDYEKYNDFLDQMEQKDRPVANPFPQPGLDKVKAAWEERQKEQDARFAQINRAAADKAAQRAEIVQEYLQRKEEARMNKRKGNDQGFRKPRPVVGVAAALRPYSAAPAKTQASEQEYLAKLQKIRAQNYNDRKQIVNKGVGPYKVDVASDVASDEQRKKKISALQKQAQDRAQLLKKNMEDRRAALDAREEEKKRKQEGLAKPREIVHPDQRPVKYNPTPIGITQALRAVGAPILSEDPVIPPNPVASPSKPIIDEKKRILQRVNQRYSMDFDADAESAESRPADSAKKDEVESMKLETEKTQVEKENSAAPRPLPQLPLQNKTKVLKPAPKGWGPSGDIGLKIAELPLQETASHMEATHVIDDVTKRSEPAKKGWAVPSGTFVRRLNQLTIHQPTMTMPPDENDELLETIEPSTSPTPTKASMEENSVEQKSPEPGTESTPVNSRTTVIRKSPESETPKQPTVKIVPNFKLSQLGTYVIPKTPETGSLDLMEKPETIKIKPTDVTSKPELVSKVSKPPSGLDDVINDDIEEVKLVDETKTTNDGKNQQTKAWSQQNQPDGQSVPAKPELKPKPRLLPKPSVSEDRTPTNVVKTPEKPSRDNTPKSSPELSDSDTLKKENQKPSTPPKSLAPVSCESPLFVKRPLPSKVTTSPAFKLPDEDMETPKVDPLSKSLYTTASDRVLLKLTMGQFDSPNPKLLRTCSLPDLASCSDAQSDDAEDPPEAGDAVRMSVASSMNDTNFDEDEEVSLPDSDAVATDDEEMNNLRANLENVLLEAEDAESSPSFSAHQTVDIVLPDDANDDECDVDDDASDDVSENGDWDSGSNASSAGEVSDTESVYSRLEHSREALERELGLKAFLEAYRYVQAIHEDEDEGVAECEARVRDVLGAKHDAIYPRILQLVMADGAYCEDNS